MINISYTIPRSVTVAFSGGVDSVATADFLRKNHDVKLLYIDHLDAATSQELEMALHYAELWQLPLSIRKIYSKKPAECSQEEHWRNERYRIFHEVKQAVITCHHLDDCVETWVWSSMHGCGKIIPATNKNVIRPFRTTRKAEFVSWCVRNNLRWAEDASNADTSYIRNYIRHNVMPHVLRINPGIHKTIRKKILQEEI
jgi:tRNA(Ile)-lysidine synthase